MTTVKRAVLAAIWGAITPLYLIGDCSASILTQFDFQSNTAVANTVAANLTATNYLSGGGLSNIAFTSNVASRGWNPANSFANAITRGDFWTFTVTAASGYAFDLSSISLDERRQSNGPVLFQIDINSGLIGSPTSTTLNTLTSHNFALGSNSLLQNITSAVVRIAAWNAQNNGNSANWINDTVTLNGNVYLQNPVGQAPELTSIFTWSLLSLFGAFYSRRPCRAKAAK